MVESLGLMKNISEITGRNKCPQQIGQYLRHLFFLGGWGAGAAIALFEI